MGLFDSGAGKAAKTMKKMWEKGRQDLMPFMDLGKWAIPGAKSVDITGGAGEFLTKLKSFGQNFQVNPEDPMFKFRVGESEKGVDRFTASRGLYNSRAALNALQEGRTRIAAEEGEKQYSRGYGQLMDSFNMSRSLGSDKFQKLFSLLGIGAGAAGTSSGQAVQTGQAMGSAIMQGGQAKLGFLSDLIGMPMNFLMLNKVLGGGGKTA